MNKEVVPRTAEYALGIFKLEEVFGLGEGSDALSLQGVRLMSFS